MSSLERRLLFKTLWKNILAIPVKRLFFCIVSRPCERKIETEYICQRKSGRTTVLLAVLADSFK